MTGDKPTLIVENLKTYFFTKSGVVKAVDGAGFTVKRGCIMGLVGESGCGKTVTGFSIIGLVDAPGNRFVFSLYEADQIWVVNMTNPRRPEIKRYEGVGKAPYDALITADGRYYIWNSRRAVSGSGCRYATTIVSRFMTRTAWRNWRSCRQANPAGFSLPMVHTKSACNDGTLD